MNRNKITICVIISALLILLLMLSSCGRRREILPTEQNNEYNSSSHISTTETECQIPGEYVLTAFIPGRFRNMFNAAARKMQSQQREMGNTFRLEVTHFSVWEHESALLRLQTQMMAGQIYDIMILEGQPFYAMIENGFLADFYQMIDNDPNLNRDDFFTQALKPFEFRGGLYAMPLNFGFEYVGINTSLPPSIINRFSQYSAISLTQMHEIYLDLVNEYPQYSHLEFGPYFELSRILKFEMSSHIDMDSRTSRLTDGEFALFLEKLAEARRINSANFSLDPSGHTNFLMHRPIHLEIMAGQFVFTNHRHRMDPLIALLEYEDPIFSHFVPLTDNMGRLKIDHIPWGNLSFNDGGRHDPNSMNNSSTIGTVIVSARANLDIAWEMVKHLMSFVGTADDTPGMRRGHMDFCLSVPIKRSLFDIHYDRVMETQLAIPWYFGGNFGNTALQTTVGGLFITTDPSVVAYGVSTAILTSAALTQLDNMKERILGYTEMQMITPLFYLPPAVYEAPIQQFMLGLIRAQAAAQEIHNRVRLWLIE
ncbi:MAG: hypothetical protein FWC32_08810 [Firmicutes bacterium]|nr:hypothetical protein [Bacillota bacterium]